MGYPFSLYHIAQLMSTFPFPLDSLELDGFPGPPKLNEVNSITPSLGIH